MIGSHAEAQMHREYRSDIDGLRALGVLAVIAFHAFPGRAGGGFVGVDVFFVVSGFLISGIVLRDLNRKSFNFAIFYARRIRRIFPALCIVLTACLAFGWFALLPDEYQQLGKQTAAGAVFASNILLWQEVGYFDIAAKLKPLLHLWSLGIEEQFYIFWPVILALIWRRQSTVLPALCLLALASFALNVWLVNRAPIAAFYLPFTRLWELLIGSILAYLTLYKGGLIAGIDPRIFATSLRKGSRAHRFLCELLSAGGILLIAGAIVFLDQGKAYPGWAALLPTIGTVMLIEAGPCAWINRRLLGHPVLVFVGLISYPLYLWHWPILSYLNILDLSLTANALRSVKLSAIIVAMFAAFLTYRLAELPIRRGTRFLFLKGLAISAALIAAAGFAIFLLDGIAIRFGETDRQVEQMSRSEQFASYRTRACFLESNQDAGAFAEECLGNRRAKGGVLLWGDSYAAHLYPGIREYVEKSGLDFAQLTTGSCPPMRGYESRKAPFCSNINRRIFAWVEDKKPVVVILSASWHSYADYEKVEETVNELKSLGVTKVVIVGLHANLRTPQQRLLLRAINSEKLAQRLQAPFYNELREIDSRLSALSQKAGADFVSPLSLPCNEEGCIVGFDRELVQARAWNYEHLTDSGSKFVARTLLIPYLQSTLQIPAR